MRELHVVALSDDGLNLVLATKPGARKGTHLLAVSERLAQALSGELDDAVDEPAPAPAKPAPAPAPAPPPPPAESALSPKEIQARLRSGQSPARIAKAAGVPLERVNRFFGPVLSERTLVIEAAQAATLNRARRGPSVRNLGESVAVNMTERGIPVPELADWDGYRRADGTWVIQLHTTIRKQAKRIQWSWQPATRTLTALDSLASAIGYLESAPRKRAAKPAAKPTPAKKPAAKKSAAKKPATKKSAAKKPAAKKSAARAKKK